MRKCIGTAKKEKQESTHTKCSFMTAPRATTKLLVEVSRNSNNNKQKFMLFQVRKMKMNVGWASSSSLSSLLARPFTTILSEPFMEIVEML